MLGSLLLKVPLTAKAALDSRSAGRIGGLPDRLILDSPCRNGVNSAVDQQAERSVARGFLFADLRGYSAFVERHGDRSGAELLRSFRDLVRATIGSFDGGEIRTEGDSFYLVFGSPSEAVRCGLAILDAAPTTTTATGHGIAVGIGVHAGETVSLDEAYVGSAVNIAARVCAVARAGELLVTDAVRAMTRTYLDVGFIPAGRRRLKGISEPIALYRVLATRDAAKARSAGRLGLPPGLRAIALGSVAVAIVLLGIGARALLGGGPTGEEPAADDAFGPAASSSVTIRPAVSAAAGDTPFPNAAEQALRDRIDDDVARHCQRAQPDEVPEMRYSISEDPYSGPLAIEAGLRCTLGSASEPDTVWYWHFTQVWAASEFFFQAAGTRSRPPGDCATDNRAHGSWDFGDESGRVLCVAGSRDAQLIWTYASDDRVMGTAVRGDSDVRVIYQWWREQARTLRDS